MKEIEGNSLDLDLRTFLADKATARGYKSYPRNWKDDKKVFICKAFDRLVAEDPECHKTWEGIREEATALWEQKLKDDKAAADAEKVEAERRREEAQANAVQQAELVTQTQIAVRQDEVVGGVKDIDTDPRTFPVVPDQVARMSLTLMLYLSQLARSVEEEWPTYREEESQNLEAILKQKKSRKQREATVYNREKYHGRPLLPILQEYEVRKFVELKLRSAPLQDFPELPEFPTAYERTLIPSSLQENRLLHAALDSNPWLMPTPAGLVCRACYKIDKTTLAKKRLVTTALAWCDIRGISTLVKQHKGEDARRQKSDNLRIKHLPLWTQFTENLRKAMRLPEPARSAEKVEVVVQALLNTQGLLLKINALRVAVMTSRPYTSETAQLMDQLAEHDPEPRRFLVKKFLAHMTNPLQVWDRMVALSTDGCSAMQGGQNGAQAHVRAWMVPFALYIWCQAHVFNLCCIAAAAEVLVMQAGVKITEKVFSLFRKGQGEIGEKLHAFKEGQKVLQVVDNYLHYRELELVEPGTTRWLSHERAAATIIATLLPLFVGNPQDC